jgi:VWFA-related protein
MTRVRVAIAVAVGVIGVAAWLEPVDTQTPVLRSGTTVVSVNVSVRAANAPVSGLTAVDFELADNGVRQSIREVGLEAVPIDATVILDTSGSTSGVIDRLKRDARDIARFLKPADRLRVLTMDSYVHEIVPLGPAAALPSLDRVPGGGATSAYDALVAALIARVDLDRRHLIVAMTDAIDTVSVLDAPAVRDVAARSDAVLHIVRVDPDSSGEPRFRPWVAYQDRDFQTLRDAAARTGGQLHDPDEFSRRGTVENFKRVLEDFRSSYVLRYTPTGVAPGGWHELKVTLTRAGHFTIRARRGYFGRS